MTTTRRDMNSFVDASIQSKKRIQADARCAYGSTDFSKKNIRKLLRGAQS